MKIIAQSGKVFKRIHDGVIMDVEIFLGIDYSLGIERVDLPEYYEEVDIEPIIEDSEEI